MEKFKNFAKKITTQVSKIKQEIDDVDFNGKNNVKAYILAFIVFIVCCVFYYIGMF